MMIQIAPAIQSSTSFSGTADAPSGGTSVPFGDLFSKALSIQGASDAKAATSLVVALLGGDGKPSAEGTTVKPDSQTQGQPVDPSIQALMQSLALSGLPVNQNQLQATTGQQPSSGKLDAIDLAGQGSGKGQKLPNLLAALAGQRETSQAKSQTDTTGGAPTGGAESFMNVISAKADDAALLAQPKVASHSEPDGQLPATTPGLAGQAAMASVVNGPVIPQSTDKPVVVNMQTSFGSPGWTQGLGDKVVWMSSNHGQVSQIVLNPPALGAVEVRLHVNGSEAGAQFFSANPDVRNALEAAMPRLREMMAGAGIALGQSTVSNQSFSQREPPQQQSQNTTQGSGNEAASTIAGVSSGLPGQWIKGTGLSLLDSYA